MINNNNIQQIIECHQFLWEIEDCKRCPSQLTCLVLEIQKANADVDSLIAQLKEGVK